VLVVGNLLVANKAALNTKNLRDLQIYRFKITLLALNKIKNKLQTIKYRMVKLNFQRSPLLKAHQFQLSIVKPYILLQMQFNKIKKNKLSIAFKLILTRIIWEHILFQFQITMNNNFKPFLNKLNTKHAILYSI